jgi:hypothetical protein
VVHRNEAHADCGPADSPDRPDDAAALYAPLNVLKPLAPDLWIVDGPTVRFGPGAGLPFTTRMTVMRIGSEGLLIHSPTPPTLELKVALARIGAVRWVVAPNRIHRTWLEAWLTAFPHALAYGARGVGRPHTVGPERFLPLDQSSGYPWEGAVDTLPIRGRYMTEVEFFHRPSRTLILTDLVENFETERLASPLMRWLVKLGGVGGPHGGMALDLRMTFPRRTLQAAVQQMLEWRPDRILISHGRWFAGDGEAELRRAFRWLLR